MQEVLLLFPVHIPPELHPPDAQGGALVNLIHSYTDNGDPFVRKFTDQLLEEVCFSIIDHYFPLIFD